MTADVQDFRKASPGPLARNQRIRELITYAVIVLLLLFGLVMTALTLRMANEADQKSEALFRSEAEMVNGGKRFIDGFYSMNAATVEYDQFRAIDMMATKDLKQKRLKYLTENDYVRRVRDSKMTSVIRWDQAEWSVKEPADDGLMRVEYKARLVINNKDAYPLNIILSLKPTEKTDKNTDGVAVLKWVDVADTPFVEGADE